MYQFNREEYEKRMQWFVNARFGMFIHWGLYAIPARGEWVRSFEEIPKEDYMKYFDEFDPVDYDPKKWAKAAKEAGMQYVVLTAKHHDGFCLFDSKYTDFKSTNTKFVLVEPTSTPSTHGVRPSGATGHGCGLAANPAPAT